MADKITYFPPINNIRMAPYNKALPSAFHYHQFDNAPFINQQRTNQLRQQYCQKVQYTDPQNFWFYSNGVVTVSLCSVDPYTGKLTTLAYLAHIDFIFPLTSYQFPYLAENGQTYDLDVHGYLHKFLSGTHPEGYYCLFVHVHYADPDVPEDTADEDFISETLWLRAKHDNTVRIKYRNSYDAYDIMWELFGMSFFLRFDSNWMNMEPASNNVVFTDQDDNVRRLYGNPYRVFHFNVGGSYGVPEWMLDKVNRAFCTDTFLINDKRYVKNDGAKLDITRYNTFPLLFSEIELREYYNDAAGAFFNTAPVTLFTRPGVYPYVNTEWRMRDKNGNEIFGGLFEYLSDSYDNGYLDYFNDVVVPQHDLQGQFSWSGDNFTYTNGPDEAFVIVTRSQVLTIYLEATINVTDLSAPFEYTQGGTGFHIIVPDVDHLSPGIVTESGNNNFGNPILVTQLYQYYTTGNKTFRLYTTNSMTVLQFPQQSNKVTAIDPATKVSNKLRKFGAMYQDFGNAEIDLTFLAPAKNELRELNLNGSNISAITAGWASALVSGTYKPYKLLRYIYLNFNKFNAAAEDAFINEFHDSTDYKYNGGWGQINMTSQSPATAPTAASLTSRNDLTTYFYSQAY